MSSIRDYLINNVLQCIKIHRFQTPAQQKKDNLHLLIGWRKFYVKSQFYGTLQNTNKSQCLFFICRIIEAQNKRLFLNKRGSFSGMTRAFHGEAATILRPWGGFELTMGWGLYTVMRGSGFNLLLYFDTGC